MEGFPGGESQAHDATDLDQIEECTPSLEGTPHLTLDGFLAAYRESPEAFVERLLSPEIDLLAFLAAFFSLQTTMLLDLLKKLKVNNDDAQELVIRSVQEVRRLGYSTVFDSFKHALLKFLLLEEWRLHQGIRDHEQRLVDID